MKSADPIRVLIGAALVALAGLVAGGCGGEAGPRPYPVTGTVTFEGTPVTQGQVLFMSEKGQAASAPLDAEGRYQITTQFGKGLPPGSYKVAISPPSEQQNPSSPDSGPDAFPNIPLRYRDLSTSGFTAMVKEGPNEFPFDMQPPK